MSLCSKHETSVVHQHEAGSALGHRGQDHPLNHTNSDSPNMHHPLLSNRTLVRFQHYIRCSCAVQPADTVAWQRSTPSGTNAAYNCTIQTGLTVCVQRVQDDAILLPVLAARAAGAPNLPGQQTTPLEGIQRS